MLSTKRVLPRLALLVSTLALLLSGWSIGGTGARDGYAPTADSSSSADQPSSSETPQGTSEGVTAGGGGGGTVNNQVVVVNKNDARVASRFGSGVARVTGDSAQNQNAAVAQSSCTDCRTVAVAVQIVLVQRTDASTIAPSNYAFAINQQCVRCQTFAAAYQYVVTTEGIVHFTAEGNQRLAALQNELRSLVSNDSISFPELDAQIGGLVQEMWSVVDNQLVLAGVNGHGVPDEEVDVALDDSTPAPTLSSSPSVADSPTPAVSDQPTASSSPTPAETTEPAEESPTTSPSPSPSS